MHHLVHHAVLAQVLRALEAVRQLLADGLLDHARAGKADQRAGLGEVHVAQHRVGGGDAAGGRVRQHHDVGEPRRVERRTATVVRGICISERMPSCMRAPPEAANRTKGVPLLERRLGAADEGLAGRHAERARHEAEFLRGQRHRQAADAAVADLERVLHPGLGPGLLEAVDVALLVAELERVGRRPRGAARRSRCPRRTSS